MQKTQATPAAALGVLAAKWLDVIERHFLQISQEHEDMRTTRLVDTLRFWRGSHLLATLDARPDGLLFTDCAEDPLEHAGLKLVEARELIGLAVRRAAEQGLTRRPAFPRPASQDRYGKVIPLCPDASAK